MAKTDFRKELKHLYLPPANRFVVTDVPPMQFLMIDGYGDPNTSPQYAAAIEALYGTAYKIKFLSKAGGQDYVVPPLEGLWWAEDMDVFTTSRDKSAWHWTMMIMQPDWITPEMLAEAVEMVSKRSDSPVVRALRLETYHEGLSVQTLHIGTYDEEGPVLHRMHHEFIPQNGYEPRGKHHEVYLSDPRRVAPEKLKTVLRQPVTPVSPDSP